MPKSINKLGVAIPVVVASALMLMAPMLASAQNPHFISASSGLRGDTLTCTFKETGLGSLGTTDIGITCTATATAVYECINKGNNHPQAANKETVNSAVSGSDNFDIRNGQTSGTVEVDPPSAGDFSCPGNQRLELASVTYTGVEVCDDEGFDCATLEDQP